MMLKHGSLSTHELVRYSAQLTCDCRSVGCAEPQHLLPAAGRSQELYYVTPDGRALAQQDTTSAPPILLDSLLGGETTVPNAATQSTAVTRLRRLLGKLCSLQAACSHCSPWLSSAPRRPAPKRDAMLLEVCAATGELCVGLMCLQGGTCSCGCGRRMARKQRMCWTPTPASRCGASCGAASQVWSAYHSLHIWVALYSRTLGSKTSLFIPARHLYSILALCRI